MAQKRYHGFCSLQEHWAELVRRVGCNPYVEEVVKQNVIEELADGTFIRGDVFRRVLAEGSALKELEQYVSLAMKKEGHYSFSLRSEIQSTLVVITYDISKYVSIDGQRIKEDHERVLPGFAIEKEAYSPTRFRKWVTKKKNREQSH